MPRALYALVEADNAGDGKLVEAVLDEVRAKEEWIDQERVEEIRRELTAPPPSDGGSAPPDDADGGEEDDGDRPPPAAPAGPNPKQARLVQDFDGAVAVLKGSTRRAADFVPAKASSLDLEMVASFLLQVVKERSR